MNVKTLKRFSKRSVSMLLSVLMVLSLFTVCMVGSSITAGAVNSMPSGATVEVELIGSTAQSWENVYIVIGVENDAGDLVYQAHYNTYAMSKKSGTASTWTYTFSGGYGSLDWYFFTDVNVGSSPARTTENGGNQNDRSINAAYNSLSDVHKTSHQDGHNAGTNSYKLSAKQYDSVSFKATDVVNAKRTKSTKDWTDVYFVVGNGSSVKVRKMADHSSDDQLPTTSTGKEYEYTTTGGSGGNSIAFNYATGYFFTNSLPIGLSLGTNEGKDINAVYAGIDSANKTKTYTSKPASTSVTPLSVPQKDYITGVTLYNYRSGSKDNDDGSGGQIRTTATINDSDETKYAIDSSADDAGYDSNATNYRLFMKYNQAVNSWFSSKGGNTYYTPLYAGNFRDTKATYGSEDNTVKGAIDLMGLNHFVYLANVAAHDQAASTVRGLVSPTLSNGKLMQGNVEIPQFSDDFMKDNPTLQSKYTDVSFEVNKNERESGNEWFTYNSAEDGNRYLQISGTKKTLVAGATKDGFFPFNSGGKNGATKCFGMKMEVKFYMPENGFINGEALQFNFTGDDDLWVYIDGYLILDMGGSHAAVSGSLDLDHRDGTITSTIENESWISNYSNLQTKANNYEVNRNGLSSNFNDYDKQDKKTTTFDDTTDAYKAITDTKKTHTMTIFYMERGLYNSNLKFEFMLPQTNTLTLKQEVDNSTVNQGLKQATMDVANKDVFWTQLMTQHMKASTTNIMHPPLGEGKDFTRLSPSQSAEGTPTTLQVGKSGTAQIIKNRKTTDGYAGVTAAYSWTDESKLIAPITADNYGAYTETAAAKNSGVATPLNPGALDGYIPLLYGQSAEFYDQFFTEAIDLSLNPNVLFAENEYIYRFNRSAGTLSNTPVGDNVNYEFSGDIGLYGATSLTARPKSTYYVNSYTIKDGYNQDVPNRDKTIGGISGTEFAYYNADGTTNQVDITVALNHVIKVGGISVKKEIDDSITSETTPDLTKPYKFKVEYIELFGDLDNTYDTNKDDDSKWKTMDRVTYTLKEDGKADQTLTTGYTEENNRGTFTLKKGQTAEIQGIPVGTVVRVSEIIETDAEYEVKDIKDGSGNELTNSTTKVVEKPMFVTQGIKDNTTYSYIIKNGLAMQTASLVINTKVTTTDVNSGIATELEKIVNDDVFGYNVRSSSKKVSTNSAKLPITSDFTRTKDGGTDTLQTADAGSGTKGNTGSTTLPNLTGMDAYYKWTDTSGRATGSGVGVPLTGEYGNANIHLQYDQTATFDSQIALDKESTSGNGKVYVEVTQDNTKTYTNGANTGTGGTRVVNDNASRVVTSLYSTDYTITGVASDRISGSRAYPKLAQDVGTNENVVIEYTFTNAVKLGQIKVSKTVTDGSDATTNPNGSYEFTLTYTKLFGKTVTETPAAGWEGTSSTGKTIITDGTGKFSIKKGETVTFAGVPVQTDYRVTEVIPTGAKYTVKGATLKVNDADPSNQVEFTRTANVCEIGKSLTSNNDVSAVTVDNTYSTVPILYRYHNRVNTNGVPTSLQGSDQWTYFVKYVEGATSTFISGDAVTSDAKTAAIDAFGTVAIDNVLATYSLTSSSTYTLKALTDAEKSKDPYYSTADTASNVGYKDSMKALADNGSFYDGNKVILATIKNTEKLYPVNVYYFAADPYVEGSGTNDLAKAEDGIPTVSHRQYSLPFNGVIPLDETITRLMLDDDNPTSLSSIGNYVFAYWEREISYRNGNTTETEWVPVSTNYQYSYRIAGDTTIRAVYRSTDGNNKKAYADASGWVVGENNSFKALTGATTVDEPAYGKVQGKNFKIFWEIAAGSNEKKYMDTSRNYTISESVAQAALTAAIAQQDAQPLQDEHLWYEEGGTAKAEYQLTNADSYCLANDNNRTEVGNAGHDVTVADKIVNPYVRQSGSTATDRVVFDIVFNCVGSYDNDKTANKTAIDNVGYVLFYKTGEYINTPVSEETLKSIINSNKNRIDNTNKETKVNLDNTGIGDRCQLGKYTVDKDGNAPKTEGVLNTGYINITNKNRVDLILDFANNDSNRKKFYTCYTYMIRNGELYVSDTPMTFSPKDVNIGSGGVEPTVETAYNLAIDNYYQNNSGSDDTVGGKNYTKANDYGFALSNAYTFADGKDLTFTIRPVQQGIYKGKLVKLMAGSNEITPITLVENGGQISYTFDKNHIPEADGNTLKLKAYFDPTPVAAKFTLNATEGIEYNVYFNGVKQEDYTVRTDNVDPVEPYKFVIVPFGKTVRVEAHTVLVNGKEGYAITDATKGSFDLADDSTRTKSQMAVKEVTVTDGMTSEALQTAIGTQPTANKLVYNVTVRKARGNYGVNITYYNQNAEEYTDTTNVMNNGSAPNSTPIQVWQGNPVITYADASGNSYKEATTNAVLDSVNSKITITDDNAVITVGGYAPLTLSPRVNATTVVTVNGTDTTITTNNQVVNVPYNHDETTGTDVTVTVTADDDYLISDAKSYTKRSPMVAAKTVKLTNAASTLTDTDLTNLPNVTQGYAITVEAGANGQVTVVGTASNGDPVNRTLTAGQNATYEVLSGANFTLTPAPNASYAFQKWSITDSNGTTENETAVQNITITKSAAYVANFVPEYSFSVAANPHSTLVVKDNTGAEVVRLYGGTMGQTTIIPVRSDYTDAERTYTCEISVDSGYVPYWNSDPDDQAASKTIVVSGNTSISTSADQLYTLTVNAGTGGTVNNVAITGTNAGTVTQSGNTYTVRASKASGVKFTLTATPYTNYSFSNWSGDYSGNANPYPLPTLDGNKTITANFSQGINITLDVSKTLSGGNKWSYTGDSAHIYVFYAKASNYNDNGWVQMTETSTDLYSALVPNGYTKVIFVRTTNGQWSGAKDQSPEGTNVYHTISETDTAWKVMAWNDVKKLVTKTVTLNANYTVDWTDANAVIKLKYNDGNQDVTIPMENTSGSIYSATITFPEGNENITFQRINPNNAGDVWNSAGANISSTVNWKVTGWDAVGAA